MGLYYQTIGEVASRNVERRAGMTAQQRKEKEPRSTEDVAWEYQLPSPQRMTKRDDGKYEVKKGDDNPFGALDQEFDTAAVLARMRGAEGE
jgi:hypothetical protein